MKLFLALMTLLIPLPVFAFDTSIMPSIEGYCQTTKDPQRCLTSFIDDARAFEQAQARKEERDFQLALARESARAQATKALALMWLFSGSGSGSGSGSAYAPYQIPPAASSYPSLSSAPLLSLPRAPINCQSYALGNVVNTSCY